MEKHLTTEEQRACLLNTLSESRMKAAHTHLEGCADCRAALEDERKRLAVLDELSMEPVPEGLAERTVRRVQRPQPSFAGLVFVATLILVLSTIGIWSFGRAREAAQRASTQGNMKQFGLIFKMYANESEGERWPQLADADGAWAPDLAPWFEKLVTDTQFMVSEQHPDRSRLRKALGEAWRSPQPDFAEAEALVGESFAYLGYSIKNEAEFETLLRARTQHAGLENGVAIVREQDNATIQPLREGVERFLITDINNSAGTSTAQSTIPVLIEIATWKYKDSVEDFEGTNVLYMDGHVEFVSLGTFPVLPSILDALSGS